MRCEKGIILAGGSGSRLFPLTRASNKQLLPIYDKPVIYYPLTTLMLAGIRDILIIGRPQDIPVLKVLLGSGEQWGLHFSYATQEQPKGLPDAFVVGKSFIEDKPVALILGDNFFYGQGLSTLLNQCAERVEGAHTFLTRVDDPRRYGVMVLDAQGKPEKIVEKPEKPPSNWAVVGLYYFDGSVCARAQALRPSTRGETEITDLIATYMTEKCLQANRLGRGYVWLDVGTPDALLSASQYVNVVQSRQGIVIASPEEVAFRMNFITSSQFETLVSGLPTCAYSDLLKGVIKDACA